MWLLVVYILNVLVGESIVIAMVWVWTELFRMPAYQYPFVAILLCVLVELGSCCKLDRA
jgi:hypothetical protein